MNENDSKYIYELEEGKYRVRIIRQATNDTPALRFSETVNGTFEQAKKIRDAKLREFGIPLNKTLVSTELEYKKQKKPKKTTRTKNTEKKKDSKRVDKYIYEIGPNKYRILIKKGSKKEKNSFYFSQFVDGNLAEARRIRDRKLAESKLGMSGTYKGNIKFYDFCVIYFNEYCKKELSPASSMKIKRNLTNYIFPELADYTLNKIDVLTLQKLFNKLKLQKKKDHKGQYTDEFLSGTSINGIYRVLRAVLNKAVLWDYLDKNPILKIKTPEISKNEKESYNKDELNNILELLEQEDIETRCIVTIAICTGLRRGEIVGLHLDDIDYKEGKIKVRRTAIWDDFTKQVIEKSPKTAGSVREVPVPPFCLQVISEYLKFRERAIEEIKLKYGNKTKIPDNIFLSNAGKIMYPGTIYHKWIDFRNKHNLKKVTLHGLRHSYCSMQMNENDELSASDVAKLMGHTQLNTTYKYTHSNKEHSKEAISVWKKDQANNVGVFDFGQIVSICTGKKYTSSKKINQILDTIVPDITLNTSERVKLAKNQILLQYPELKNLKDDGLNVNNVWDWLDDNVEIYGNAFKLEKVNVEEKENNVFMGLDTI